MLHDLVQAFAVECPSVEQVGKGDVLIRVQDRHQIVELIDQADLPAPEDRQFVFAQAVNVRPADKYLAFRRLVHAAEDMQQGRFAAAGRTDDRDEFPCFDRKAHMVQRGDLRLTGAVYFRQVFCP